MRCFNNSRSKKATEQLFSTSIPYLAFRIGTLRHTKSAPRLVCHVVLSSRDVACLFRPIACPKELGDSWCQLRDIALPTHFRLRLFRDDFRSSSLESSAGEGSEKLHATDHCATPPLYTISLKISRAGHASISAQHRIESEPQNERRTLAAFPRPHHHRAGRRRILLESLAAHQRYHSKYRVS